MPTKVVVIANQKGGVGKTTLAMNLAAVAYAVLAKSEAVYLASVDAGPNPAPEQDSPVMVASTDPQASSVWWARRLERQGGVPFDFAQVDDPRDLRKLKKLGKRYIFVDTPGSMEDEAILAAALNEADEVLVPMVPEPLAYDPTSRTIDVVIKPRAIPFRVVVNAWDPRDGTSDLEQTAQYIVRKRWPMCNTVIRRYKLHTRASADGIVVTQYPKNRTAAEAREDFFRLALELGYGGPLALPRQTDPTDLKPLEV